MKKFAIAAIIAVGIVGLVALLRFKPKSSDTTGTTTTASTPSTDTTLAPTSSSTTSPATTTGFKDGTYTGTAIDNGYGIVQVSAVVSGGKLTDVKFLQMPSGGHSSEVTSFAKPALLNEALTAQSANVNIVSGATQDSLAFQQSLGAALAKAS